MWLIDLEKALAKMREEMCDFNFVCLSKITPRADGGINFYTTYHTVIVYKDGEITEKKEGEWRNG